MGILFIYLDVFVVYIAGLKYIFSFCNVFLKLDNDRINLCGFVGNIGCIGFIGRIAAFGHRCEGNIGNSKLSTVSVLVSCYLKL